MKDEKISESIKSIQNDLFNLGTMLAISNSIDTKEYPSIDGENIKFLENLIDLYNEKLLLLNHLFYHQGQLLVHIFTYVEQYVGEWSVVVFLYQG